jgi:hypothetical protein
LPQANEAIAGYAIAVVGGGTAGVFTARTRKMIVDADN